MQSDESEIFGPATKYTPWQTLSNMVFSTGGTWNEFDRSDDITGFGILAGNFSGSWI